MFTFMWIKDLYIFTVQDLIIPAEACVYSEQLLEHFS